MCCGTSAVGITCNAVSNASGTYYGTTTDGTDIYQNSSGAYVDQDGNSVSAAQIASADTATGNPNAVNPNATAVPSQSTLHTAAPSATVNSPGSGGSSTSGMTGLFSAIGSAFGTALNPPKTVAGVSLVYNPATGTYGPATGSAITSNSNLVTYLVIGAVAVALLFVIMAERK